MNIPVFHDDQHGTAVISGAGLLNALDITNRRAEDMKVVVVGAGAAGIACATFYVALGVDPANIYMFDSRGLIHAGRSDLNSYKKRFAQKKDAGSLEDVMKGADMFLGLSTKDLVSKDMVRAMAKDPVLFAMANPDPEIAYPDAKEACPGCIMGTGRSDFPNQVNNVSGFPYIFRGALDVGATEINEGHENRRCQIAGGAGARACSLQKSAHCTVWILWSSAWTMSYRSRWTRVCWSGKLPPWRRRPWIPAWPRYLWLI